MLIRRHEYENSPRIAQIARMGTTEHTEKIL